MSVARTYGPLLWHPRTLRVFPLLLLGVAAPLVLDGAVFDLADLREMAADPAWAANARRIALRPPMLLGLLLGLFVGTWTYDVQRMHASWTLPSVRRNLWVGQLLAMAAVAAIGWTWVALWAAPAVAAQAALYAIALYGLVASWGHLPLLLGLPRAGFLLPIVAIGILVLAPSWLVAAGDAVGLPGLAVLAAGGVALVWRSTRDTTHRALLPWAPELHAPDRAALDDASVGTPRGTMGRLRMLSEEVQVSPTMRRLLPYAGAYGPMMSAAFLVVFIHVTTALGPEFLAMAMANRPLAAGLGLPYAISRRERARLEFAAQGMTLLAMATVVVLLTPLLQALDVPTLPWFADEAPRRVPLAVRYAACFALLPLAQAGIPWLPLQPAPMVRMREMVRQYLPFLPYAVVATVAAKQSWRLVGEDAMLAVTAWVAIAVAVQAANYAYLQAVFARRDLVSGRG